MTILQRAGRAGRWATAAWLICGAAALGETLTLKNGMLLEGSFSPISSVGADPLNQNAAVQQIVVVDNQLTRAFVGTNQVAQINPAVAISMERIKIPQKVAVAGSVIGGVGSIRVDLFDQWGRRRCAMTSTQGTVELVQGITEITPKWTKVEAIQGTKSYVWTMRIATSSVPREQLSKILLNVIDPTNSEQRLRVVRLYLQSERYQDARLELEQLLKDFPALAHLQEQVKELHRLSAQRLLKEIDLRLDAGQFGLGIAMLEQFPAEGVPGEMLLKARGMRDEHAAFTKQGERALALLTQHMAALEDDLVRQDLQPLIAEIRRELGVNTLDRMADYLRLADDPALKTEQKLSLAVSGWLLGSGAGIDNLSVSRSLTQARNFVRQYLNSTQKPDRDQILADLNGVESATPKYVAKLIAHMRPPLEAVPAAATDINAAPPAAVPGGAPTKPTGALPAAPEPAKKAGDDAPADSCAPASSNAKTPPAAAAPTVPATNSTPATTAQPSAGAAKAAEIPGFFEFTTPGLSEDPQIKYFVQLPPDYDSFRRYPCVVTLNGMPALNGAVTTPEQQIDWWAGEYVPAAQTRYDQATRHGYIVIAPRWAREHQRKYEYTAREHAAVLRSLRDAQKRFSIDTDRVFLSGHSMGGDAAWDIGLAHPDLWAGVMPIVATADKYVTRYWENGKYVSFYFVCGEKDGNKLALNATDWDRYLKKLGYDTVIVQYQGRGHEHFHDEIQNLFAWMNLHKRNFFPREFDTASLRPWDNFFWWVETEKPKDTTVILPAEWGPGSKSAKQATPAEIKAKRLEPNGVTVTAGAHGKVTVWLAPEIVNFDAKVDVRINKRAFSNVQPTVATILEDVRTRGDRQHPFWANVEN